MARAVHALLLALKDLSSPRVRRVLLQSLALTLLLFILAAAAIVAGTRWALARLWRPGWGQAETRLSVLVPPDFPDTPTGPLPVPLLQLDSLAADDWARLQRGQPLARPASPGRQWRMAKAAFRLRSSHLP